MMEQCKTELRANSNLQKDEVLRTTCNGSELVAEEICDFAQYTGKIWPKICYLVVLKTT